ncbi:MAG TPA: zinc-dependent metalloprotease [Cyclobacteriaceae bacterium]|nr:zinc-dependent metalloprotease [Cyclobacteriaceae bacterium]
MRIAVILLFFHSILISAVVAQQQPKKDPPQQPQPVDAPQQNITIALDTPKQETPSSVPAGNAQLSAPQRYNSIIGPGSITREGIFTVHKVEDSYYFEIPDSLLGRDLLVVSRIAQGAAGIRRDYTGYAGDQIGNTVIRFEKGPSHKLFLRRITFEENAGDTSSAMYDAVQRSNLQPLVAAFGIGAYNPNGKSSLVDVTDYINGDNEILFFNALARKTMKVGSLVTSVCYIKDIVSFPMNLEIRTIKTYQESGTDNNFTLELNTSILLLPKKPMRKRFSDPRVGYFTERYLDYAANPQGVKTVSYIKRWRLEPKSEDVVRYILGDTVEPTKQIIYYIDPATPKAWVPYIIQGINDWQIAFEKAGFKNAIVGKVAPVENEAWSLEDSRHSAVVYKPSAISNASGPTITDPRSGEILETHVNWYHNLMSILQQWYMIQCGPNDPRAQTMKFDEKLMGSIIRSVAAHEVGHTLGLTHNYGASSTVKVENLRDKQWLKKNGICPSVMDYARFNYVAQPQDSVPFEGLVGRVGPYDTWAIEWGYRWFPQTRSAEEELPLLNKWVVDKAKDHKFWFASEFSSNDPRVQAEDIGDNAMHAGEYGIKNLQRVVPNLIKWTYQKNEGYRNLNTIYSGVIEQFNYYLDHVLSYVGGTYETNKSMDQPGPVFEPVGQQPQVEAMNFLARHVFNEPKWLLDTAIISRLGQMPVQKVNSTLETVLNAMTSTTTLIKLVESETAFPGKTYPLMNYMEDIDELMWDELRTNDTVTTYRRNLQRLYVTRLIDLINAAPRLDKYAGDISAIVTVRLEEVDARLRKAIPKTKDVMTKYHLKYLQGKVSAVLKSD